MNYPINHLNTLSYNQLKDFALECIAQLEAIEVTLYSDLHNSELWDLLHDCEFLFEEKFRRPLPEIESYYRSYYEKKSKIENQIKSEQFEYVHRIYIRFLIGSFFLAIFILTAQYFHILK